MKSIVIYPKKKEDLLLLIQLVKRMKMKYKILTKKERAIIKKMKKQKP